jgi:hypothetical protein
MTKRIIKPQRNLNSQLIDFIHRPVLTGQMARFSTVSVPRPEKLSETPTVSLYAAIIEEFEAAIACQKHRFRDEDGCTCCAMAVVA